MTDVFGVKGRVWLGDQCRRLPVDEQQTVDACLRQIDFLGREIELVDIEIAKQVLASEDIRRLMTLPGISGVTATAMLAAIGDVSRFPTADHLVGYLGLSPRVRHQATSRLSMGGSASRVPGLSGGGWSKRRGTRRGAPVRCARFISGFGQAPLEPRVVGLRPLADAAYVFSTYET